MPGTVRPVTDEQDALLAYLDQQRDVLVLTSYGLTDEEARSTPAASAHDRPWFPADVDAWSVRWVLLHLIQETARHAGHADVVREALDGATAFPLMAAAGGWPASPWITPWSRDGSVA